jgi:hypothetical protein
MHVATKVGLTNGGYIPYSDYSRDYSPPNSLRALKNHLVSSANGHSPHINSTTVTSTMNGGIHNNINNINNNNNTYSLSRNRELRQDNGLPTIPLNTMPNGMISKYYTLQTRRNSCCRHERIRDKFLTQATLILDQSLLNNVDIRYSATYGNPYLKSSSISPLPPPTSITHKPYTANPSVTPAPPPYNRSNNSNSSFSSSTTISNSGSLLGGASLGLSYPNSSSSSGSTIPATAVVTSTAGATQITSPSRQFILPANGDLKKGSLATHV